MNSAFKALIGILEESGPSLFALLTRLTLRADAAEELLQELFLKLHRSDGFQNAENQKAYVFRTAINLAFDWRRTLRAQRQLEPLQADPPADDESSLQRLVDREDIEQILEAAEELPTLSRTVVVLRYLQQQDYAAIAKTIDRTEHQVRALCAKGLTQLRAIMRAADGFREGEVAP